MEQEPRKGWKRFEVSRTSRAGVRKKIRKIESSTIKHAHKFIIKRWVNVREVRRHAVGWMALVLLLTAAVVWQGTYFAGVYSKQIPAEDVAFSEGVVGSLDTMNPIFSNSLPERSASELIFSGLLRYDKDNNLSGDLAQQWKYEDNGKRLIVALRPDLKWHDGAPLTSADVVYTIDAIKNPSVRSPLYNSWRDITVNAIDQRTVEFTLPSVYAPFIDSLTVGILPKHILSTVNPVDLRSAPFNRAPVGSGPFVYKDIKAINGSQDHIVLNTDAYADYHLGAAKLSKFYIHAFAEEELLRRSFVTDEINAAVNLSAQTIASLPENKRANIYDAPLYNGTYAFFRTSNPILKDANVRKALQLATNRGDIIAKLDNRVRPLHGPLLGDQLKDKAAAQALRQPAYNLAEAEKLLDAAGWKKDESGKRMKDGQSLSLTLASVRSGDFPTVVDLVASDWNKLGVSVKTQLAQSDDFQQSVITPRAYDVLVYELAIGHDPDVYAYWHSSQSGESGLNLSEYSSGIVDDSLASARTRLEPNLRDAKYRAFYQQWLSDVPAVALYQPTLHYAAGAKVTALGDRSLIDAVDRYAQVRYWSSDMVEGFTTP